MENENNIHVKKIYFYKFIQKLNKSLYHCFYKKTLLEIRSQESSFSFLDDYWRLIELKVKILLKILERKLNKYNHLHIKYHTIDKLLDKINDEIEKFYNLIANYGECDYQMEIYLQLYLNYSYQLSTYYLGMKNIEEAVGVLSISEKLINQTSFIIKNPDTLFICQKILLSLSRVLIADNDFENAKLYQKKSLIYCQLELSQRLNNDEMINMNNYSEKDWYNIEKIFLNMLLIFYHNGVCEENLGNNINCLSSYKTTKWISQKFLMRKAPEFVQFISEVTNTCKKMALLLFNPQLQLFESNKNRTKISSNPEVKQEKEIRLVERVEGIKAINFQEIEMNENTFENERKSTILYSMRLYNKLLSKDFKDVINNLDNFNLHNMDKPTKDLIQKQYNKLSREMHYKKVNDRRKTTIFNKSKYSDLSFINERNENDNTNNEFPGYFKSNLKKRLQSSNIYANSFISKKSDDFSKDSDKISKPRKDLTILPDEALKYLTTEIPKKTNETSNNKSSSPITLFANIKKNSVDKYNLQKYYFSPVYRMKNKHLNIAYDRELSFQKKLLRLKKNEMLKEEKKTKKIISLNVKKSLIEKINLNNINSRKESKDNNVNSFSETINKKNENMRNEAKREQLKIRLTKSLHSNSYKEYMKHLSKMKKSKIEVRKEFLMTSDKFLVPCENEIEAINKKISSKIDNEIDELLKLQTLHFNEIHPKLKNKINKEPNCNLNKQLPAFVKRSNTMENDLLRVTINK